MDIKRKKELLEIYKNRHPEMGVISYRCRETGEVFWVSPKIQNQTSTALI